LDYIEVDQAVQLDDSQFVCVNHVQLDDLEKVAQLDDGQVVHLDYIITDCWPTAYVAMVQVDRVSSLVLDCGSSLELDHGSTGLWFNQTLVQLDCLIIDQAISSQLRVGQYPSHRAVQSSKASFKTHLQLVRSRSLPIKLAFTTSPKNVISRSEKLSSASKKHSR
jgi:hypothetical protein